MANKVETWVQERKQKIAKREKALAATLETMARNSGHKPYQGILDVFHPDLSKSMEYRSTLRELDAARSAYLGVHDAFIMHSGQVFDKKDASARLEDVKSGGCFRYPASREAYLSEVNEFNKVVVSLQHEDKKHESR
jgi:hypothetical protein